MSELLPSERRALYPSLAGKRVLVTGGGSGIGAGIVSEFLRQGSDVTYFDLAENPGCPARFEQVDLMQIETTQALIAQLVAADGGFDILINNAANDDRHDIEKVTPAYWDDRINVNLRHQFFCAQAVLSGMKKRGGGAIVNLGSISWHLGIKDLAIYQTAKAAIEGMTRAMSREFGECGIRVTCVVPGNVRTPRQLKWYTPEGEAEIVAGQALKGRLIPEDIAAMVLFLASEDARLITGHEYFVDAGWR